MYICRFVCMCRAWRIAAKAPQPKQHAALPGHHWSPNTLGLRPKTLNLGPQTPNPQSQDHKHLTAKNPIHGNLKPPNTPQPFPNLDCKNHYG